MSFTNHNNISYPAIQKLFALIDCNNFYASCERIFNPTLRCKPVVILSNNDGCIIARSNEAKKLGIPMGAPYFAWSEVFKKHNVFIYSSNFTLYGDISNRVMQTIMHDAPTCEIYSIDEAFVQLDNKSLEETRAWAYKLQQQVQQWIGIPISIGIGSTKTLAKLANKIAKENSQHKGIYDIRLEKNVSQLLMNTPVGDIWGVGKQSKIKLNNFRIYNAWELTQASDDWIRKKLTIAGLRTAWELRGISCIELCEQPPAQKSIACTRSFGNRVTQLNDLQQAVADYTAQAAQDARKQKLLVGSIVVFIHTSFHIQERYYKSHVIELPSPTAYTPELIHYAQQALKKIFISGYAYKKAGVILLDLVSSNQRQSEIFENNSIPSDKKQRIMRSVDAINSKWGRKKVFYAAQGITQTWKMKQNKKSQAWTTDWNSLLTIRI